MHRVKNCSKRNATFLALSVLSGGMLNQAFCSAIDIKHNITAGTMDFIAGYAEDFLAALIPSPDEIIGEAE